ncbi:integrase catalytic domain-containing protein [Trichonephila clavipes]|nr:integrase catalytic domain-containing protein [Trichonephila clavipes]
MKRKENFQWLPKELHQLKYEAISVPQGSVRLVKKTQERKSSTCYLLITKGVTSSSPVPLKTRRERESGKIRGHELELARIKVTLPVSGESQNTVIYGAKKKFNLPKLEFRQFSGDIKDRLQFWSQFQHIHDDYEIAPENKFQYLVQATVNGSRAREVVDSFPATATNYAIAVESLKARFGRDDLLMEVYVRVTTEKCASILYPMVESCFQEDFLKAWNRNTSAASKDAKERLTNLMTFLKAETEGEERINLAMAGFGLSVDENR